MDFDIDHFVLINKRILRVVGLYPVNYFRYFGCVVCMGLIVVPQAVEIWINRGDFDVVLETSSVLLTILLAILKSIIWISRRKTFQLISFFMNDYWKIAAKLGICEDYYQFAKSARKITMSYCFLILNSLMIFFTLPLTSIFVPNNSTILQFPFAAVYPDFCYKSPTFELVYISQMLATSVCGLIILATDTLIATTVLHTCGHFAILQKNILRLGQSPQKLLKRQMRQIVRHHQVIIWFSNQLESLFNPLMLMQVLASSLIICLVGFQVNSAKLDKMPQYFSYLMMALFQILLLCWPGDELIIQSLQVSKAAFSSKWYYFPMTFQRDLIFVLHRAQKYNFLSAGKFSAMNLENFSAILSTSLSYFMLLRSFSEEQ